MDPGGPPAAVVVPMDPIQMPPSYSTSAASADAPNEASKETKVPLNGGVEGVGGTEVKVPLIDDQPSVTAQSVSEVLY